MRHGRPGRIGRDIARHLCRGRRMSRNAEIRIVRLQNGFLHRRKQFAIQDCFRIFCIVLTSTPGNYCAIRRRPEATRVPVIRRTTRDVTSVLRRASQKGATRARYPRGELWRAARAATISGPIPRPRVVMQHQKSSNFIAARGRRRGEATLVGTVRLCGPISGRPTAPI